MRYAPTDWLDVVAMRVEGCSELLGECGFSGNIRSRRPVFRMWAQFRDAMVQQFELVTEIEEVRKHL